MNYLSQQTESPAFIVSDMIVQTHVCHGVLCNDSFLRFSTDAYTAIPVDVLGTEYFVPSSKRTMYDVSPTIGQYDSPL